MRKILVFYILLISVSCFSKEVTKSEASKFAIEFLTAIQTQYSGDKISSISVKEIKSRNGLFYIATTHGWVIMSNSKQVAPILAYSTDTYLFNELDIPISLRELLQDYEAAIQYAHEFLQDSPEHPDWQEIIPRVMSTPYAEHILQKSADLAWGQSSSNSPSPYAYNMYCPNDTNTHKRSLVGCVAVALGEILWYHQWPHVAYVPKRVEVTNTEFRYQSYNWDSIPTAIDTTTTQYKADNLAFLLRDCGYSVHMNYTDSASNASMENADKALRKTFDYNCTYYDHKTLLWTSKLKAEINAERPILYSGYGAGTKPGHAFVVNGYNSNNFFHMNWGWRDCNCNNVWYNLDSLIVTDNNGGGHNYSSTQSAIMAIRPKHTINCSSLEISNQNYSNDVFLVSGGSVTISSINLRNTSRGYIFSGEYIHLQSGFHASSGSNICLSSHSTICQKKISNQVELAENMQIAEEEQHSVEPLIEISLANQSVSLLDFEDLDVSNIVIWYNHGMIRHMPNSNPIDISFASEGLVIIVIYAKDAIYPIKIMK